MEFVDKCFSTKYNKNRNIGHWSIEKEGLKMAKKSGKGSDFLGGLFDFNRDGKTSFFEKMYGVKMFEDSAKSTTLRMDNDYTTIDSDPIEYDDYDDDF